ncbi:MAG: 5'/3'-nucleotidase SurE [Actinobacteria bacterium]|nr:5'/3'-nucleotidase SurE [Actinomycetota bacterium]
MTWILVTNDDGIDSPALVPLARALQALAPVRVVAPHTERSWIGKAITRYDPVRVEVADHGGIEIHVCSGYPADCVQLGVNTLFDTPPALVVSGINLGYNHGTAYAQSSGTVGAVLEAGLAGVDGLALSTGTGRDFFAWRTRALSAESLPMWERLAAVGADLAATMLEAGPQGATVSVNMPDDADLHTERRLTRVADTGYDRMFREDAPGTYVHDFRGGLHHLSPMDGTDVAAAADGVVAVTPVRPVAAGVLPGALDGMLHPRLP